MRRFKYIITIGLLICNLFAFGQENNRSNLNKNQAREILEESLTDSTLHNVITKTPILKEKEEAVDFAELVLFNAYGKNNIENQKPYNVFKIDEYWFISGTLPSGRLGGTFMIIIDSRNYQVIRLTHEK